MTKRRAAFHRQVPSSFGRNVRQKPERISEIERHKLLYQLRETVRVMEERANEEAERSLAKLRECVSKKRKRAARMNTAFSEDIAEQERAFHKTKIDDYERDHKALIEERRRRTIQQSIRTNQKPKVLDLTDDNLEERLEMFVKLASADSSCPDIRVHYKLRWLEQWLRAQPLTREQRGTFEVAVTTRKVHGWDLEHERRCLF